MTGPVALEAVVAYLRREEAAAAQHEAEDTAADLEGSAQYWLGRKVGLQFAIVALTDPLWKAPHVWDPDHDHCKICGVPAYVIVDARPCTPASKPERR